MARLSHRPEVPDSHDEAIERARDLEASDMRDGLFVVTDIVRLAIVCAVRWIALVLAQRMG